MKKEHDVKDMGNYDELILGVIECSGAGSKGTIYCHITNPNGSGTVDSAYASANEVQPKNSFIIPRRKDRQYKCGLEDKAKGTVKVTFSSYSR